MRKPVTLGIVAISCLIALPAADRIALAQAGSTGGTIGKTDKSASGGDELGPHQMSRTPGVRKGEAKSARGSCQNIVGVWTWMNGTETVFNADGTGRNSFGGPCTWKCVGGAVVANWNVGVVDRITISGDGKSVLVNNSNGDTFAGTRK